MIIMKWKIYYLHTCKTQTMIPLNLISLKVWKSGEPMQWSLQLHTKQQMLYYRKFQRIMFGPFCKSATYITQTLFSFMSSSHPNPKFFSTHANATASHNHDLMTLSLPHDVVVAFSWHYSSTIVPSLQPREAATCDATTHAATTVNDVAATSHRLISKFWVREFNRGLLSHCVIAHAISLPLGSYLTSLAFLISYSKSLYSKVRLSFILLSLASINARIWIIFNGFAL